VPALGLLFLLSLSARQALAADEEELLEAAAPAPPPAVELVVPADAIQWAWIVPAPEEDEADVRLVTQPPQADAPEQLGTIRFQYDGETPAEALRIVATVPIDLDYVADSATGPGAETAYDAESRQVAWTIAGPLDPGTRGLVSFRAVPRDETEPGDAEAR
jgi:hypothetical protein